jgi:hypothetical protein
VLAAGFSSLEFQHMCLMCPWSNLDGVRGRLSALCKRFLDLGRAKFLEDRGFTVTLQEYVDGSITPENWVLLARRTI